MADYKHLRAAIDRKLSTDPEFRTIVKRINSGRATLIDTERYSQVIAHTVSKELSAEVLDLTDREAITAQVLRDSYDNINEVCARVQKAMDEKAGIHIRPQQADFPGERVSQFTHSLVDPTVKDAVIKRRARAGSDTITKSFHDDYIKKNATFRNDAGLTCYIIREGSNCCKWCSDVAGKYKFGTQPEDIFRRHDNCDCTIIYDGQVLRGKQNADGSRSKTWEEIPEEDAGAEPPVTFTKEQARQLEQEKLVEVGMAEKVMPEAVDRRQIDEVLNTWEAENYKNSTEKGLLILPDGTTKDFGGIEHHVTGHEGDIKLMNGATFTHNHPIDNTFSSNDIVTGLVKGNLKEMRAVTSTGDVHILVNNGATEAERRKFFAEYQQRRMKAANAADAKIRKGVKLNKDEYIKSRLETFMFEQAEEYSLSYTKHRINVRPKNIVVQGGFDESKIISDDIKVEISRCIEKVQGEYNVKVDIFSFEEIEGLKVPFQFVPVDDNGKYKSKFVINKGFNWERNLDKLNERIYNKNYSKGILASQNTEDLIYHEMAHFMTFQECDDFYDYVSLERSVRRDFKSGVSMYSDVTEDGAETIAEAFVRIKNNETVSDDVKELVRIYVERWRK